MAGASASALLFFCALDGLDHANNRMQRFPEPKHCDKQRKENEQHWPAGTWGGHMLLKVKERLPFPKLNNDQNNGKPPTQSQNTQVLFLRFWESYLKTIEKNELAPTCSSCCSYAHWTSDLKRVPRYSRKWAAFSGARSGCRPTIDVDCWLCSFLWNECNIGKRRIEWKSPPMQICILLTMLWLCFACHRCWKKDVRLWELRTYLV